MRIILMGKPGSGKGTQASMLAAGTGLPHLSSGAILRDEIRERTLFGLKIEEYVLRGEIGPAELITDVVFSYIERKGYERGFILDGFPRTIYQAEKLDERFPPGRCLLLDVPDELIVERISGRLNCSGCGSIYHSVSRTPAVPGVCDECGGSLENRDDDRPEAIRRRLKIFRDEVQPVVDRYRETGRLITIEGAGAPDTVHEALKSAVS